MLTGLGNMNLIDVGYRLQGYRAQGYWPQMLLWKLLVWPGYKGIGMFALLNFISFTLILTFRLCFYVEGILLGLKKVITDAKRLRFKIMK